MKKYIKPAIEIVKLELDSAILAASDPNSLTDFNKWSTPDGTDADGDGIVDEM